MGLIITSVSVDSLAVTPTLMWRDVPLFDISDGFKLVEYCECNNIAVLGIEGFKVKDGRRIPDMDCIVDFSASINDCCFARKTIEASRRIMNEINDRNTLLEFVLVKI